MVDDSNIEQSITEENVILDNELNEVDEEEETTIVDNEEKVNDVCDNSVEAGNSEEQIVVDDSEVTFETSQDLIHSLLNDIVEQVFSKSVEMMDTDNIKDTDINDTEHLEFDRIEEVNEPEEQPDEISVRDEEKEESIMSKQDKIEIREDDNVEEGKEEGEDNLVEEGHEESEDEYGMVEDEPQLTREELILKIKNAEAEKIALFEKNTAFQHKLGEYLRRKKADQPSAPITDTKDLTDFDQKYIKLMETLKELIEQSEIDCQETVKEIEELKVLTLMNEDRVQQEKENFKNYRFAIAQKSLNTRTGKSISQKDMEDLNAQEEKKEDLVLKTRLESIKLQNEVNRSETILKSKEELADGLHLIDFEQFKIENQSYNEKLEERTEDLLKLRKKITSNVHVLTHVKEKLEFVKSDCETEAKVLQEIDDKLNESRDNLTGLKQARDKLRIANDKMKRSSGMLGNKDLLRNYESCVDTMEMQVEKMSGMKNKQLQLSLRNQALQMKIENTRKSSSAQ